MPTVAMIRQPPKLVPIPMVSAHSKDDPEGDLKDGGGATRQHGQCKHTHEFLAVVEPMIEGHERSGEDLEAIERAFGRASAACLPEETAMTSRPISERAQKAKAERTDEPDADLLPAGPLQGLPNRRRPAPAPASPASSACDLLTGIPRRAAKAPQAMMLSIVAVIAGRVMAEGADNAFAHGGRHGGPGHGPEAR